MLRQEPAASAQILHPPIHFDARADSIAIRFHTAQPQRNRAPAHSAIVAQDANLRPQAALQHDVQIAVAIDIGRRERTRVVREVDAADARKIEKPGGSAARRLDSFVKHVRLAPAPTVILADELIDGVPTVLVFRGRAVGHRRFRHDLPPEETIQIFLRGIGHHARGNEDLGRPVVIEIQPVGAPGPPAHRHPFLRGGLDEPAIARVAVERVTPGVAMPGRRQITPRDKCWVLDHALARRRPHVRDIQIGPAVTVVIEPRGAHAGRHVCHARFGGFVPKGALAIPIEIAPAKIVSHIQVGPAVAIVIAPSGRKAEPVVVVIHAGLRGDVFEEAAGFREPIAKQIVGRSVSRVVIGNRIAGLVFALKIDVGAKVQVQAAVAVVIRGSHARKRTLGSGPEAERVRHVGEDAVPAIGEVERSGVAQHHKILMPGIAEVGEQRARAIVQHADARLLRNIYKGGVAAVLVQTVRQSAGLANIDFIPAVVVDVAHRHAVGSVHRDSGGGI